jgi:hypothetical protein
MSIISMAPSFSAAAANEIGVLKRPPLQIQSLEASPEPEPPFRRGHGRTLVPRNDFRSSISTLSAFVYYPAPWLADLQLPAATG